MAKIPAGQLRAQLETIAKKLTDGYTDMEIMKELKISRATFYLYKHKIFKIYGDIAAKKTEESLELEAAILKDRYTRLYRQLEIKMNDQNQDLADIAAAAEIAAFIATNILKLEVEGLRARQQRGLNWNEQKALRYLRSLPTEPSKSNTIPCSTGESESEQEQQQSAESIPIESVSTADDTTGEPRREPSSNGTDETVF